MKGGGSDWSTVEGLRMHARFRLARAPRRGAAVLVHGLLVSSRYMVPLADELVDFDVWAPDMPGFGLSARPPDALDVVGLGRKLAAWLDERDLTEVVLVVNSFGCQYAVDYLARHSTRVRACVLAGPTMEPGRRTAAQQAGRWLANAPLEPWSLGAVVARDLLDAGIGRVARTYAHGLRDPIEDKLPHVAVPTVVARGSRDPLVVQQWADQAARLLPAGRLEVVPGAAHTINFNAPAAVAAVIRTLV